MDFQKKPTSNNKISFKKADCYLDNAKKKLLGNISSLGNVITDILGENNKNFPKKLRSKKDQIYKCVMYFFVSFLMGCIRIYDSTFPFGTSFLCAFIGEKYSLYCISGSLLSAVFTNQVPLVRFTAYVLLYSIRKVFSNSKFNEKPIMRISLCAAFSLFIEISSIAGKYISFLSIFNIITCCLLSACSVYLFYIFCNGIENKDYSNLYTLSLYAVFACTVSAVSRFSPFGLDLDIIYAGICVLFFSKSKGPIFGCVAGFIFGFACCDPLFSAPMGVGGLICGYLFTKSFSITTVAFSLCSSLCALYLFGFDMLSSYFPYVFTSSLIFLIIGNNLPIISVSYSDTGTKTTSNLTASSDFNSFNKVSDSLSGLSSILYKFAEHMKCPSRAETSDIFDNAFNEICSKCSMNTMCYAKRESDFSKVRDEVTDTLRSATLKEDHLSKLLLHKCIRTNDICDYINRHYSELRFITAKSNRTGTVACLYNSMSKLIKETEKEDVSQNVRDFRLEKIIGESLKKIGVEFTFVICKGSRTKDIYVHGIKADKIPCSAKDLSLYLSKQCRLSLSVPSFDISDSADMIMKITRREIIGCEYAQCTNAKEGEEVSGDTASFFDSDTGYFYSLVSDGMGSGKTAAATSRLSCVFLEKLLQAGTKKSVCLELLNNLLLSKNDETFSSVDLLEIDKLNSSASFIKSGAAASYILRGMKLYKIQSKTPPVGIIHSFSAESTSFSLNKGDVIIMLSDGVMGSLGDERWLSELIRLDTKDEPALLAGILIERAKKLSSEKDDMTACVIKII